MEVTRRRMVSLLAFLFIFIALFSLYHPHSAEAYIPDAGAAAALSASCASYPGEALAYMYLPQDPIVADASGNASGQMKTRFEACRRSDGVPWYVEGLQLTTSSGLFGSLSYPALSDPVCNAPGAVMTLDNNIFNFVSRLYSGTGQFSPDISNVTFSNIPTNGCALFQFSAVITAGTPYKGAYPSGVAGSFTNRSTGIFTNKVQGASDPMVTVCDLLAKPPAMVTIKQSERDKDLSRYAPSCPITTIPPAPTLSVICDPTTPGLHDITANGSGKGTLSIFVDGVLDIGPGAGTDLPKTITYGAGAGHTYSANWNGLGFGPPGSAGDCVVHDPPPVIIPPDTIYEDTLYISLGSDCKNLAGSIVGYHTVKVPLKDIYGFYTGGYQVYFNDFTPAELVYDVFVVGSPQNNRHWPPYNGAGNINFPLNTLDTNSGKLDVSDGQPHQIVAFSPTTGKVSNTLTLNCPSRQGPVGMVDTCQIIPGGYRFYGWGHDADAISSPNPDVTVGLYDTTIIKSYADAYSTYKSLQDMKADYAGTIAVAWNFAKFRVSLGFDEPWIPIKVSDYYNAGVGWYVDLVIAPDAGWDPWVEYLLANSSYSAFMSGDTILPSPQYWAMPPTVRARADYAKAVYTTTVNSNPVSVVNDMISLGYFTKAQVYKETTVPTDQDYNTAYIDAYLAAYYPEKVPRGGPYGFVADIVMPFTGTHEFAVAGDVHNFGAPSLPDSPLIWQAAALPPGAPGSSGACAGPPTFYDLQPTSLKPTLLDDAAGNTYVVYSHSVTNGTGVPGSCSATQDSPSVPYQLHITKNSSSDPDIPGTTVSGSLGTLGICASTSPGTLDSPPTGINIGPLPPGTKVCTFITVNPGSNRPGAGGPRSSYPPEHCETVTAKPFLKAYGADVRTGAGFAPSPCAVSGPTEGSINAYGGPYAGGYHGSSGQFGVTALLSINGFYSASLRSSNPQPPKGLTFSNMGGGTYGGNFGASTCITNYFGTTQVPSANQIPYTGPGSIVSGKKQYTLGGGSTLNGFNVPSGSQMAIYVNGDLYINGDITVGSTSGSGPSIMSQLAFLAVIVKGNIYIAPNVTHIDGLYVAQSTGGSNGKIYTCAPGVGLTYSGSELSTLCGNPLVINGGLVAQQVKFLRTNNTLNNDTGQIPDFNNGTGTAAAEVINYTPEMWLAPSPLVNSTIPASATGKYDAIFSLPPVY